MVHPPAGRKAAGIGGTRHRLAVALLCFAFLLQGLLASRGKSPTSDEPNHIVSGASYIATRRVIANPQHPPLLKELAGISLALAGIRFRAGTTSEELGDMPRGWEWPAGNTLLAEAGVVRALFWARLPLLLLSPWLVVLIYLWGKQIGGAAAGLGGAWLFAADPTMVAHSYLVTTDVGVALFSLLFLLCLYRYLCGPTVKRLGFAGVSLGLALGAKFSAVLLLPIAAVLMALDSMEIRGEAKTGEQASSSGRRILSAAGALTAMCLIAAVVIQILYFSPRGPILYYQGLRQVNADHLAGDRCYLLGQLAHHFASYFAVAWLVKEPLATIALALGGALLIALRRDVPRRLKLFLFVPPAVFVTACTLWADDLGIRYIIPAMVFGYVLGGAALSRLWSGGRPAKFAAALTCLWVAVAAAGIYPDHLSYFNEAACLPGHAEKIGLDGGSRCGTDWLADSNVDWGQGLPQLKAWMERNRPGKTARIEYFGTFPPEGYGIRSERAAPYIAPIPPPGLYAISAHAVATGPPQGDFAWMRQEPLAIVGHAYYIFEF